MHKRLVTCFVVSLMIVTLCGAGHATLIVGTDVVYDDVSGLTWLRSLMGPGGELQLPGGKTYAEQMAIIGAATWLGITDWQMATHDDIASLWAYTGDEIGNAFGGNSVHMCYVYTETGRWYGRVDHEAEPGQHYTASLFENCITHAIIKDDLHTYSSLDTVATFLGPGAWVVSVSGAPVPEPTTMLLIGTGLVGLVGFRRKFRA